MAAYFSLFIECLPTLLSGLEMTLFMAVVSLIFACIIGVILGIFSISNIKWLEKIATCYIYVVRGVPLMVLGFFIFFGIGGGLNLQFSALTAAVISLTINASAYMAEIFRGGIQAVDIGQVEAARSLGLSYIQAMMRVVLPQAIKIMIPAILNQFITTIKDTSILSAISVRELVMNGEIIVARNFKPFEVYSYLAIMYLIVITILSLITRRIERNMSYDSRGK